MHNYSLSNFQEGVNDLTIQNVTQEDAGEYICQINTEPMKNYVSQSNSICILHYVVSDGLFWNFSHDCNLKVPGITKSPNVSTTGH